VTRVLHISVIDDDESVRESLRGLFRSTGFGVETFAHAEEFLESDRLRTTDCIIADIRMPGMSGLELQRRLKQSEPRVPVILITGHGDEEMRARALESGAAGYLLKPFGEYALLHAVETATSAN
jgi:FixJ family two-component response regulator